jgi:glucose-1-phosphate thymidylyltransferase
MVHGFVCGGKLPAAAERALQFAIVTDEQPLKGLVLCGGKGTRLRPLTYTGAKQLIPIANRPILFYAIDAMVEAGVHEIGVITGDTAAEVREALGNGERFGARFTYIHQEAPLGIAHAVKLAQPFLRRAPFILFLGDNFLRGGIEPFVRSFRAGGADAQLILKQVSNPSEVGVVLLDDAGRPVALVEKPAEPPSDLAVIGIYLFGPRLFEAIDRTRPSQRGELEITDSIQTLINMGGDVRAGVAQEPWIDTGKPEDVLRANRLLLDTLRGSTGPANVQRSRLTGEVVLQAGARVTDSVIEGPAIIGEQTEITGARIGPYASIYHHCLVRNCWIEDSIVLERTSLDSTRDKIAGSLIGRDVQVAGGGTSSSWRLALGDHSRVELP